MPKLLVIFILSAIAFCFAGIDASFAAHPKANYVEDELLVRPTPFAHPARVDAALKARGARVVDELRQLRIKRIKVPAQAIGAFKDALSRDPNFNLVEENYILEAHLTPNDTFYQSNQGHLSTISAPGGWDISTGSGSIIIAVTDTGVDSSNPELTNKLIPGYNFYNNSSDTTDHNGHGTSVAGTAAAQGNNGAGIAGVAWQNPVMPIAISGADGHSNTFLLSEAIVYATDHGAKVVNISFGGTGYDQTLQDAVNYAWDRGVIVVASAGNSSTDTPTYPAALDHVIAVSAANYDGTIASFSNFGAWIDVTAPGVMWTLSDGGVSLVSGTSFSAPLVSGLMGLMLSVNPNLMPIQLQDIVEANCDDLGAAGFDQYFGYGRINMQRSLQAALNSLAPGPDMVAPSVVFDSPGDGETVNGTTIISARAIDNVGVTRFDFFADDVLAGSFAASTIGFSWNTTGLADGVHTLRAVAYDGAGNIGSAEMSVMVNNSDTVKPSVAFAAPTAGSTVNGIINVTVSSSDNIGVTKILLYINNILASTATGAITGPVTFSWDTTLFPDGSMNTADGAFVLTAEAYDAAGNVGTTSMTVIVNNIVEDVSPPTVQIASPAEGAYVSGDVYVTINYSDNKCVTEADLYANGELVSLMVAACIGSGPVSGSVTLPWNSRTMNQGGPATLSVYAYDSSGNKSISTINVIVAGLYITTSSLLSGTTGSYYSQTLSATGGVTPYTWYVLLGNLPAGLSLSTSGVISGTPAVAGTYNFTTLVVDVQSKTAQKQLSIVIKNPLTITTSSLAPGATGSYYSQTLSATGGVTPYTWSVLSGDLPAGLSLSTSGVISGTPAVAGTYSFITQVIDVQSNTVQKQLSMNFCAAALNTKAPAVPYGTLLAAYLAAQDGDTIQSLAVNNIGDINFNKDISITVKGGYDCSYASNNGWSRIQGTVTISAGTLVLENVAIE